MPGHWQLLNLNQTHEAQLITMHGALFLSNEYRLTYISCIIYQSVLIIIAII